MNFYYVYVLRSTKDKICIQDILAIYANELMSIIKDIIFQPKIEDLLNSFIMKQVYLKLMLKLEKNI